MGHLNERLFKGATLHSIRTVASMITGLKKNNFQLTLQLDSACLVNNLIASLKGCNKPEKDTLLGPRRNCEKPKIFRSNNVTKATAIRTGKIKIKK